MLTIRLQRLGKKKQPSYRLVISENARDTQGNALEILGHYDPVFSGKTLDLKEDRINYWLSKGAQTSVTVHNLLVKAGVITEGKKKSVAITKKRKLKMGEKIEADKAVEEDKKAKAKAAEEAAKAKADEEKAIAESTKVEEAAKIEEVEAPTEEKTEEKVEEASVEEKKEE